MNCRIIHVRSMPDSLHFLLLPAQMLTTTTDAPKGRTFAMLLIAVLLVTSAIGYVTEASTIVEGGHACISCDMNDQSSVICMHTEPTCLSD